MTNTFPSSPISRKKSTTDHENQKTDYHGVEHGVEHEHERGDTNASLKRTPMQAPALAIFHANQANQADDEQLRQDKQKTQSPQQFSEPLPTKSAPLHGE